MRTGCLYDAEDSAQAITEGWRAYEAEDIVMVVAVGWLLPVRETMDPGAA